MNIAALHPQYLEFAPKWARARDLMAGQEKIKESGEQYLRRLGDCWKIGDIWFDED